MLSQNPLVQIDEDELLEELEALTAPKESKSEVIADGVIKVDDEIIELPSVPVNEPVAVVEENEEEQEYEPVEEKQKELIAE